MNPMGTKKGATNSPGTNRRNKQNSYLFYLLFGTIMLVLLLALFNALWSDNSIFQWLLIGSVALLIVAAIVVRFVFHLHIKTKHIVLWLMLLSLAGTAFVGLSSRRGLKRAEAALVINGYAISAHALDRRAREIQEEIRQIRAQAGPYADMVLQMRGYIGQPKDIAVREITQEKLLLGAADLLGISSISPEYIIARLRDSNFVINNLSSVIPSYLAQGSAGVDEYKLAQYLKHQGIVAADFEEALEDAIRSHVAISILPTSLYTPQVSLKRAQLTTQVPREFAIEHFSLDAYIAKQHEPVTEEALKNFFDEQNRATKRYFTAEKRRGTVWVFNADAYHLPNTDIEIRRYFADHSKDFDGKTLAQVKGEIEKALVKEKFKKRFVADAQRVISLNEREPGALAQFLEKRGAKKEEIGWINRSDANKPQTKALFALLRAGQKNAVAGENQGFIVILDEIQPSILPALADIRDRVAADLRTQRAWLQLKKDMEACAEKVKSQGISALSNARKVKISSKNDWEDLQKQGLPVDRLQRMIHTGAVITNLQEVDKKGGNCIVLTSMSRPVADETAKMDFNNEFTSRENSFFASAFIASLNSSATIKKGGKQQVNTQFNDEE